MPNGASTSHLYLPKLFAVFAEGYGLAALRRDAAAGLTVAIIALPLSMAIAVASGVPPERGLYSAIIGGFLVSALGGSRYQIGGPAGAFIVLVSATVARFGVEGMVLTVLLSGALMTLMGLLRLGSLIRLIPHEVTVGFSAGIAVTILASQLRDLGGLTLAGAEPGPLIPKLAALADVVGGVNPASLVLGLSVAAVVWGVRKLRPSWPNMLIALVLAAGAAALLHLPVATIGSRFGDLTAGFPAPRIPRFDAETLPLLVPSILSFTLLGGVESLLSAKIADRMTGRVHRSNMELVAQGLANVAASLFGGVAVTGTIARTAANIRAGAQSPVAGILHAAFLLVFLLIAAPLARFVPLPALAGVLVVVAWNMVEGREMLRLLRGWRSAAILLTTLGLTLAFDLTIGIAAGCVLATLFRGASRLHRNATNP